VIEQVAYKLSKEENLVKALRAKAKRKVGLRRNRLKPRPGRLKPSPTSLEPSRKSLKPKWLLHDKDPEWLKLDRWLNLANLLSPDPLPETADEVFPPSFSFGIRSYRMVDPEGMFELTQKIRGTLDSVVSETRPKGIDRFEPTPFSMFISTLEEADLSKIRRCPVCSKYFYAQRKDQIACSRPCSNTERQRRFRINRPVYEKNRKRNLKAKEAAKRQFKEELDSRIRSR